MWQHFVIHVVTPLLLCQHFFISVVTPVLCQHCVSQSFYYGGVFSFKISILKTKSMRLIYFRCWLSRFFRCLFQRVYYETPLYHKVFLVLRDSLISQTLISLIFQGLRKILLSYVQKRVFNQKKKQFSLFQKCSLLDSKNEIAEVCCAYLREIRIQSNRA